MEALSSKISTLSSFEDGSEGLRTLVSVGVLSLADQKTFINIRGLSMVMRVMNEVEKSGSVDGICGVLNSLASLPVTLVALKQEGAINIVKTLFVSHSSSKVSLAAKGLLSKWKSTVMANTAMAAGGSGRGAGNNGETAKGNNNKEAPSMVERKLAAMRAAQGKVYSLGALRGGGDYGKGKAPLSKRLPSPTNEETVTEKARHVLQVGEASGLLGSSCMVTIGDDDDGGDAMDDDAPTDTELSPASGKSGAGVGGRIRRKKKPPPIEVDSSSPVAFGTLKASGKKRAPPPGKGWDKGWDSRVSMSGKKVRFPSKATISSSREFSRIPGEMDAAVNMGNSLYYIPTIPWPSSRGGRASKGFSISGGIPSPAGSPINSPLGSPRASAPQAPPAVDAYDPVSGTAVKIDERKRILAMEKPDRKLPFTARLNSNGIPFFDILPYPGSRGIPEMTSEAVEEVMKGRAQADAFSAWEPSSGSPLYKFIEHHRITHPPVGFGREIRGVPTLTHIVDKDLSNSIEVRDRFWKGGLGLQTGGVVMAVPLSVGGQPPIPNPPATQRTFAQPPRDLLYGAGCPESWRSIRSVTPEPTPVALPPIGGVSASQMGGVAGGGYNPDGSGALGMDVGRQPRAPGSSIFGGNTPRMGGMTATGVQSVQGPSMIMRGPPPGAGKPASGIFAKNAPIASEGGGLVNPAQPGAVLPPPGGDPVLELMIDPCQFYGTFSGCKRGPKCQFIHSPQVRVANNSPGMKGKKLPQQRLGNDERAAAKTHPYQISVPHFLKKFLRTPSGDPLHAPRGGGTHMNGNEFGGRSSSRRFGGPPPRGFHPPHFGPGAMGHPPQGAPPPGVQAYNPLL